MMTKRIFALLLVLTLCTLCVGCSGDGAPDGMYLASHEDEPFKLYVPDSWTGNKSSGISGAFISGSANIAVSARYFTPSNAEQTLAEYADAYVLDCSEGLELFSLSERSDSMLGGENAVRLLYSAQIDGVSFMHRVYIAKYAGDFVTLAFHAPSDMYDGYSSQFDTISDSFVLCEKSDGNGETVTDKHTPSGMRIASSDVIEYRLYVPNEWICDPESGKSEAYYPESGRPNVTVTSYSPDKAMTAEEYFAECETEYKKTLEGYELISSADRTVGERAAKSYTYRTSYGETQIRIMQTVFVYNQVVYSFTYTALEDSFEGHMEDVEAMLTAFRFR